MRELLITIVDARAVPTPQEGPFSSLAGAWVGLVDCERFMQEVYASRQLSPQRPVPRFEA